METAQLKALLEKAYNAAWDNAGDGWNGEILGPVDSLKQDVHRVDEFESFVDERAKAVSKILAEANA